MLFLLIAVAILPACSEIANAFDIFSKLNDEMIELYEKDVAHKEIVSSMPQAKLQSLATTLNISTNKLKAVLIINDLSNRVGEYPSLKTLSKMSDFSLIAYAKDIANKYADTLDDDKKTEFKNKLKEIIKFPL